MKFITVEELKEKLEKENTVHLFDVREEIEHDDFNIGGINYPISKIKKMDIDPIAHLKNEEVICYCRNGQKTSNDACLMLEYMGFTNVVLVGGGVRAWEDKFEERF